MIMQEIKYSTGMRSRFEKILSATFRSFARVSLRTIGLLAIAVFVNSFVLFGQASTETVIKDMQWLKGTDGNFYLMVKLEDKTSGAAVTYPPTGSTTTEIGAYSGLPMNMNNGNNTSTQYMPGTYDIKLSTTGAYTDYFQIQIADNATDYDAFVTSFKNKFSGNLGFAYLKGLADATDSYSQTPYKSQVLSGGNFQVPQASTITTVALNPSAQLPPVPSVLNVVGSYVCMGASGTISLNTSETGVVYELYKNGVSMGAGQSKVGNGSALAWTFTDPGIYTIYGTAAGYTIQMGVAGQQSSALYMKTNTLSTTVGCANIDNEIKLASNANVANGVTFSLYQNGALYANLGTASGSTLGTLPAAMSKAGTYSVRLNYNGTATSCDIGTFEVGPTPVTPFVSATTCGDVIIPSSQAGVTYSLDNGQSVAGTGADVTIHVNASGTFTVSGALAGATCKTTLGQVTVVQVSAPTFAQAGTTKCLSEFKGQSITMTNTLQPGAKYDLYKDGVSIQSTGVVTDASQTFSFVINSAGKYKIVASAGACTAESGVFTVTPTPSAGIIIEASCTTGSAYNIKVANAESGVIYYLRKNGAEVANGTALATTYTFATATTAGTYDVVAKCGGTIVAQSNEVVIPRTTGFSLSATSGGCAGNPISFTLNGSETGVDYYVYRSGVKVDGPVAGTGGALVFNIASAVAGNYSVVAVPSGYTGTCTPFDLGLNYTVSSSVSTVAVNVIGGTCAAQTISLSGLSTSIDYFIYKDGVMLEKIPTGNSFNKTYSAAGVYSVWAACGGTPSEVGDKTFTVVNSTLNTTYRVTDNNVGCANDPTTYMELSGSQVGAVYQVERSTDNGTTWATYPFATVSGGSTMSSVLGTTEGATMRFYVSEPGLYRVTAYLSQCGAGSSTPLSGTFRVVGYSDFTTIGSLSYCTSELAGKSLHVANAEKNVTYTIYKNSD